MSEQERGTDVLMRGTVPEVRFREVGVAREETLAFHGTTGEYFRIWIVNLGLTVVTLGIYAAWAKVAKRRYFWRSTELAGARFDYSGEPIPILKGNLIVAAGLGAYLLASSVHPLLPVAFAAVTFVVFPWLFCKAMRFNAHHTRYRNIRFRFHGTVGESYAINLGLALLLPLTLGLIAPYMEFRRRQFQLGNLAYGTARFAFRGEAGPFYRYFFVVLGLGLVAFVAAVLVGVAIVAVLQDPRGGLAGLELLMAIPLYLAGIALALYYATRVGNYALSQTRIEGVGELRSSLRVREVLALELVNALAIVASVGLAIPWAAIRRARYRLSHVHVTLTGPIDRVAASMEADQAAFSDVAAEQLDFDISL